MLFPPLSFCLDKRQEPHRSHQLWMGSSCSTFLCDGPTVAHPPCPPSCSNVSKTHRARMGRRSIDVSHTITARSQTSERILDRRPSQTACTLASSRTSTRQTDVFGRAHTKQNHHHHDCIHATAPTNPIALEKRATFVPHGLTHPQTNLQVSSNAKPCGKQWTGQPPARWPRTTLARNSSPSDMTTSSAMSGGFGKPCVEVGVLVSAHPTSALDDVKPPRKLSVSFSTLPARTARSPITSHNVHHQCAKESYERPRLHEISEASCDSGLQCLENLLMPADEPMSPVLPLRRHCTAAALRDDSWDE
ncbi:Hypothetical protein, putative [Bodo saltans]|uniref:Uncharacterized protein n=1 Tax=Bodo saltans TaxID=75058 RepID=A0A0S4IZE0_BODSA|nr:Hypothetical protein, putative [Bodo saltans]|eukprot:CUG19072.1 Hypothetical protein, putative [Bodo saltans]